MPVRYEEWRDRHANNAYPFLNGSPQSVDGTFQLPDGVVLDASLHIPDEVSPYYLARMYAEANELVFEVETGDGAKASGRWSPRQRYVDVVHLISDRDEPSGVLTVNPSLLVTVYHSVASNAEVAFNQDTAIFSPSTYAFVDRSPIQETPTNDIQIRHNEDIVLVGRRGVFLECDGEGGVAVQVIGDPRGLRTECEEGFEPIQPIREVVFQRGNVTISCKPIAGNMDLHVFSQVEDSSLRLSQRPGEIQFNLIGR